MQRKINFNAGPAELPSEVLYEVQRAVRKYSDDGMSILELPHRSKEFVAIVDESKQLVKDLCGLNDDYEAVWMHGGGRMQFAAIPMNFLKAGHPAGYIDSGHWSAEALEYAGYYGETRTLASSREDKYCHLPAWPQKIAKSLSYVHLTTNNTIYGTQWNNIPKTDSPLIADMSSDILSRHHDYTQYSMFYAAAQKNLGTPGVALAVIHKDLLKQAAPKLPPIFSYKELVKENSILNTANVSGIYTSLLMLRWIKERGMDRIEKENAQKAALLYNALDASSIFTPYVQEKAHRSLMNVCFTTQTPEQEKAFLTLCNKNDITGIQGHRSIGGFRASLYNAVTLDAVERLVTAMKEFEASEQ